MKSIFAAAVPYIISLFLASALSAKTPAQIEKQLQANASLPTGYQLSLFASGMKRPRLMVETSAGDVIVSSYGSKIYLLSPDNSKSDNSKSDASKVAVLMGKLNQPHGVLLDGDWLYVAEEHRVTRIRFNADSKKVSGKRQTVLTGLPNNGGHSSRTLKKGPDGWFYLTVGSSCNVCVERHPWRAAMLRFNPNVKEPPQIFATGLRNTVGFDWHPKSGKLYGVENGRDWLGDDFPPDELNQIEYNGFYGWPFRHGNNIADPKFGRFFKGKSIKPAFAFGAHTAPLSIRFLRHQKSTVMKNTALVAQHGSWNRSKKDGYRLVSLHFDAQGKISRKIFLKGFLKGQNVIGRPVDIFERKDGSLLISDDKNGTIWLVRNKAGE